MRKFLSDPLAFLFLKSFQLMQFLLVFVSSLYNYIIAKLKGVELNGFAKCNGIPYLFRVPGSRIVIGKNNIINSAFKSNNIGLFARSRITTNKRGAEILIGDNVGMSAVTISAFERIEIGDKTLIGGNVLITDSDWHPLDPIYRGQYDKAVTKPVCIGKNVFIGTRSIILKGTVIGDNTVIGAGSVVSGNIPANVIACGNPCRVIKRIGD